MKEHNDQIERVPFTWALLDQLMGFVARMFKGSPPDTKQTVDPHALRKGSKDSIRLLCLAPTRNGQLLAYAYDGQVDAKGKNHLVPFATGETDRAKAMVVAELLIKVLKKGWEQTYGDYPFYDPEIRTMQLNLPHASDTVRGLYHAQACSMTQPVNILMLTWKQAEEAMEAVLHGRRIQNGNPFQFYMSPELFAWLKERRKKRPHDRYVFH